MLLVPVTSHYAVIGNLFIKLRGVPKRMFGSVEGSLQGGSPEHGVKVGSVQWKVRRGGGSPEGNEGAQLLYTTGTRY